VAETVLLTLHTVASVLKNHIFWSLLPTVWSLGARAANVDAFAGDAGRVSNRTVLTEIYTVSQLLRISEGAHVGS
jgi:hypothetical protein